MSSTHGSETEGSAPSAGGGVWGFMKRKVWGDVPSHPISDSGSDSRAVSPAVDGPAEMSAPKAASPPEESGTQSPFQGHNQSGHDSQSDEDAPENLQTGTSSGSNRATAMASEPSLRHGLGEGEAIPETHPGDAMNRVASLAAGIGGSGFEWNPHPAAKRSTPAVKSDAHSETNLTFSPTTNADQIAEPTSSMFKPGSEAQSDAAYHVADFHPSESNIQQIPDEVMYDEEDSSMSDFTNVRQEQEEESAPSFESMQTSAPGLPPLRLHPKSAPEKPRVPNPPPPTSFPASEIAAQGGTTPDEIDQGGEQQGSRHGADLTPSPRTGAIVDALLEGVVSDNLATGDTPQRARQQPPQTHMHGAQQVGRSSSELDAVPHGATQVGPAPTELESLPHGASQVDGESDEQSGALRIPQIGAEPLAHGALQLDAMPKPAHLNIQTDASPDYSMDSPRSTTSNMSGMSVTSQGTPRSPFRRAVGYAETAIGLTGGAVAGIMAGTALVGIGAAALTGGAVLNAVDFPRSPRQARSSASDTDMSEQTEAATAQQDALPDVPDLSRSRLDRLSSSAKRQADSSWADFESPHKRQEFDQSPADTAAAADRQDDRSSMTDAGDASAADAQNAAVQGSAPGSSQAVGSDAVAAGNSGGGLLSYIPGTQANRASHANDRDQHASSAVGGLASYIPGTQANRAAHADQTPDPYLGDGPAARLASYIPGGTTAGRLASYLPGSGTAGRLADYAVSRAEQGFAHYSQHPTAEASLTGSGVSSVRDTGSSGGGSSSGGGGIMSYIPGTEANQTSTAAHNLGLDSPLDIPAGRDPASDIPGTQATQGSHAEQGQDSESGSGKGGTGGLTRHAPDGDADTASGSLPGQSGGGSLAGSPASHATGREANQEFAAEQGPRAQADTDGGAADGTHRRTNDGSASGAGDSLVGSVSGTEAHRTAEVEGRHNAASASNTGSGVDIPDVNSSSDANSNSPVERGAPQAVQPALGDSPLPTVAEEPNAEKAAVEATQPQETQHSETEPRKEASAESDQSHQAQPSQTRQAAQSPETQPDQSQPQGNWPQQRTWPQQTQPQRAQREDTQHEDSQLPQAEEQPGGSSTQSQEPQQNPAGSFLHVTGGGPGHPQDATHSTGHADSSDAPTDADAPQEPTLQSGIGQQQAAEVEGPTARRADVTQEDSAAKDVAKEAAEESEVGQQQAGAVRGETSRQGSSSDRPQTQDVQTFSSQHSVHSAAPDEHESMFAEPLTSGGQTQQPKGQAGSGGRVSGQQSQTKEAQTFASEHQVNNEAPSSQEAMFAEPLTSDTQSSAPQRRQGEAALTSEQSGSGRPQTGDTRTFALPEQRQHEAAGSGHSRYAQTPTPSDGSASAQQGLADSLPDGQQPASEGLQTRGAQTDAPQQQGHGTQARQTHSQHDGSEDATASQSDSAARSESDDQSLAGRLFGLIAQGQGHAESQAARQADSPSRSTPTGIAPHEPALHSEAGRQQAAALDSQAARHSGSPQGVADAPEEPALKSDIGQQQAGIVEGREPHHACATEGGEITSEGPEEPSLRSGVAHRAAAAAKEEPLSASHQDTNLQHANPGSTQSFSGRPQTANLQTFPSQYQVQNEAPGGEESMFAQPLTSHNRAAAEAHPREAAYEESNEPFDGQSRDSQAFASQPRLSSEAPAASDSEYAGSHVSGQQTVDNEEVVSRHQVNDAAPANQQNVYSDPRTSDRHPPDARHSQHQASADGEGPLPGRDQAPADQTFALEHQVTNEAPDNEVSMMGQPLTADGQTSGTHSSAQHHMSTEQVVGDESGQAQPLSSDYHSTDSQHRQYADAHQGEEGEAGVSSESAPGQQAGSEGPQGGSHQSEGRSPRAEEPHQSLTGRIFSSLFGGHTHPQQPEGPPAFAEQPGSAHTAGNQAVSRQTAPPDGTPDTETEGAGSQPQPQPEMHDVDESMAETDAQLHSAQQAQRSALQAEQESLAVSRESLVQLRQSMQQERGAERGAEQNSGFPEGQLQGDVEDEGMAEADADLHSAQQAQREALQAEQESLQSSRQGLAEVREAMQQQTEAPGSEAVMEAADTQSQGGSEGESTAETDAALSSAQQAQHEAMLTSQNSLNDSRKRLQEVREAMQQQHQEEQQYGHTQQDDEEQQPGAHPHQEEQQQDQRQQYGHAHQYDEEQQSGPQQGQGMSYAQGQQYDQGPHGHQLRYDNQQSAQEQHSGPGRTYTSDLQQGQGQTYGQSQPSHQNQGYIADRQPGGRQQYHDESMSQADADLHSAQQAQREALRAEQESLQSSRQGLQEVREVMQQDQRHREIPGSGAGTEAADTQSQGGSEGESAAETDAALFSAQQAQREAMLAGRHSLNDSRKRLLEVREAMHQQYQEEQQDQSQQYDEGRHYDAEQQQGHQQVQGQQFSQEQDPVQDPQHGQGRLYDRNQYAQDQRHAQGQQGAQYLGQYEQHDPDQHVGQHQPVAQDQHPGQDQQYHDAQLFRQDRQYGQDQQSGQDQQLWQGQQYGQGPDHGQQLHSDQGYPYSQQSGQERRSGQDRSFEQEQQPGQDWQFGQQQQSGQDQQPQQVQQHGQDWGLGQEQQYGRYPWAAQEQWRGQEQQYGPGQQAGPAQQFGRDQQYGGDQLYGRAQAGEGSYFQGVPTTADAYEAPAASSQAAPYAREDTSLPVSRDQPSMTNTSRGGFSGSYHISHHIDDAYETSTWHQTPQPQQPAYYEQDLPQQQQQHLPQYEQNPARYEQQLPQQQQQHVPQYEQNPGRYEQQLPQQQQQHVPQYEQNHARYEQQLPQQQQHVPQYEQNPARYEQDLPQEQLQQRQQHVPQYEQNPARYKQDLPQQQQHVPQYEQDPAYYGQDLQQQQQLHVPQYEQNPAQYEQDLPQQQLQQQQQHVPQHEEGPKAHEQGPSQYTQAPSQYEHEPSRHEQLQSQHEQAPVHYEQEAARYEELPSHYEQPPQVHARGAANPEQAALLDTQVPSQHGTPLHAENAPSQRGQAPLQEKQRQVADRQVEAAQAPEQADAPQQQSPSEYQTADRSASPAHQPALEFFSSGRERPHHSPAESAPAESLVAEDTPDYGGDGQSATDSTAAQQTAAQGESSGYVSAPPSSLWGRATAAIGSLAAALTGNAEGDAADGAEAETAPAADSSVSVGADVAGRAETAPEADTTASMNDATPDGIAADTAGASHAETADGQAGGTVEAGEAERARSGRSGEEGYAWTRPATHANFGRGNVNPKPARLRPALPQDWVQAVDDRADQASTPTSARSIPEATSAAGAQPSRPSLSNAFSQGTDDTALAQIRGKAPASQANPVASAQAPAQPPKTTAVAEAPQPAHDVQAAEQPTAVEAASQLDGDTTAGEDTSTAGKAERRDAVKVQQQAAQDPQGWQHAGLGGSVAPVTPQAANATPPQPVPESMPHSSYSGGDALLEDQQTDTAVAEHAEPAAALNFQPKLASPAGLPAGSDADSSSLADPLVAVTAPESSYSNSSPPATLTAAARPAQQPNTGPVAASNSATRPADHSYTGAQPASLSTEARASAANDGSLPGSNSAKAAERIQPPSAAMLSLDAMIPPPFDLASSQDSSPVSPQLTPAGTATTPPPSAFQNAEPPALNTTEKLSQPERSTPPAEMTGEGTNRSVAAGFGPPLRASAPPPAELAGGGSGYLASQGRQLQRLDSPEVQRQIEQTAEEVQEAVNERGRSRGQAFTPGENQEGEALARATGTLRALVAGRFQEAESLSSGLPKHSGPTENYPSERQAAAMRSVDGTTQAAKAASLEKGMEASFVFATADRAAAMLKALAVGKPLDKMESVPEAAIEGLPSAERLHDMGFAPSPSQGPPAPDQAGDETPFEPEASEGSFVSATSRAALAGNADSDTERGSVVGEPADELDAHAHAVGYDGKKTRAASDPANAPAPMGTSVWGVRGTPVDQDSTPPATGPTQDPIVSTNAVPSAIPPSVQSSGPHAEAPTAASLMSVPNEGLASPHAVPVPVGSLTVLRSTPVDWGSPAQAPTPPLPPTSATAPVAASTMQPVRPDATTGLAVPSISGRPPSDLSSNEVDIENVNPQAVAGKQGASQPPALHPTGTPFTPAETPILAGASPVGTSTPLATPATTSGLTAAGDSHVATTAPGSNVPSASAAGSTVDKPWVFKQPLADAPALSSAGQGRAGPVATGPTAKSEVANAGKQEVVAADTAAEPVAVVPTASKPFVSSQALSDALFGSSGEPEPPVRCPRTAQTPTSPFAQASSTAAPAVSTAGTNNSGVEGVLTEQPRVSGMSAKDTSRAERIEEALMSSTSPFSRRLSSEEVKPVMARLSQDAARHPSPVKETPAEAAAEPGVQSQGIAGVKPGGPPSGEGDPDAGNSGQAANGAGAENVQPAEATSGSAPAAHTAAGASSVAATPTARATAASQPPAKRITEADDGKARFVCCGFGGKKAGSKRRK